MLVLLACLGAHAVDPPQAPDALEQAYQKEFAYLVAEKRSLEARQGEVQRDGAERIRSAERALDGLQGRLMALERQAANTEDRVEKTREATLAAEERADLVASTVQQATEALGADIPEDASDPEKLRKVFATAASTLAEGSRVKTWKGEFFAPNGERLEGDITLVGQIGAWGVASQGAGSLLPLGGGRLMLREKGGGEQTARALVAGQRPETVEVFLIESLDKAVGERTEQSAWDVVVAGGVVAFVIVGLGFVALFLAAVRAALLTLAARGGAVEDRVIRALDDGDLQAARALVARGTNPTMRVIRAVLASQEDDREALRDVASEALLRETPAVERFGSAIIMVAAVAPLLGLLGTVTGMISTFEIITEFGTGDPKMLSGGISEALITTQLGLIVAIPAVLMGNLLNGRADATLTRIERAALRVINTRAEPGDTGEDEDQGGAVADLRARSA